MSCIRCDSERLIQITGKCSDLCFVSVPHLGIEHQGYVPPGIGVGYDSDYVEVTICADCGQSQDSVEHLSDKALTRKITKA